MYYLIKIFVSNNKLLKKEFFKCNRNTLKYWKDIVNWASDKGDLFNDFLSK
jgi:hypothetical protein